MSVMTSHPHKELLPPGGVQGGDESPVLQPDQLPSPNTASRSLYQDKQVEWTMTT